MKPILILTAMLAALLAPGAAAARFAHCYDGEPPAGVLPTPEGFSMEKYGLGFAIRPVVYRKLCGMANADDAAYLRMVYQYPGCTAESDVGRSMEELLQANVRDMEGMTGGRYERLITNHRDYYRHFCGLVGEMPWPVYTPAYHPISPEIRQKFTEKMREIETYKADYWEAVRKAAEQ